MVSSTDLEDLHMGAGEYSFDTAHIKVCLAPCLARHLAPTLCQACANDVVSRGKAGYVQKRLQVSDNRVFYATVMLTLCTYDCFVQKE